jgi:hypothetical protein
MEELYAEGLATHGGPESCVDVPRGRGEALTGARAGRAIEPRNLRSGVPTRSQTSVRRSCQAVRESFLVPLRTGLRTGVFATSDGPVRPGSAADRARG